MRTDGMSGFLSEDTVRGHVEYYRRLRCRCSIFEKSVPEIRGCTIRRLMEMRIDCRMKNEILPSFIAAKSHELYFSSFCEGRKICPKIKEYYSSEAAFLYELFQLARGMSGGFLYVARDRCGKPVGIPEEEIRSYRGFSPCLALDMAEHAYFPDYGFEKERYISAALSRLNLCEIFSEGNYKLYLDTPI